MFFAGLVQTPSPSAWDPFEEDTHVSATIVRRFAYLL